MIHSAETKEKHSIIWDLFCSRIKIADTGVTLFDHTEDLIAATKTIGIKLIREVIIKRISMIT